MSIGFDENLISSQNWALQHGLTYPVMYDRNLNVCFLFTFGTPYLGLMDTDQILRLNDSSDPFDPAVISTIIDTMEAYFEPFITLQSQSVDFGVIDLGYDSTISLWIVNSGTGILDVTSASGLDIPFSVDLTPGGVYAINDTLWFDITFGPVSEGVFSDELIISTNAGDITVSVEGEGLDPVSLSANIIDFGVVAIGESVRDSVWINNIGAIPLDFSGAELVTGDPFALEFTPIMIPAGNSAYVTVIYTPMAVSNYSDQLIIHTGAGDHTVDLSGMVTGIEQRSGSVPADFALYQNHPNPFNPATVIEFDLPGKAYTLLEVFDVNGSMIDILWEGGLEAGRYAFTFNGQGLSSGLYFCRLTADNFTAVSKLVLVK